MKCKFFFLFLFTIQYAPICAQHIVKDTIVWNNDSLIVDVTIFANKDKPIVQHYGEGMSKQFVYRDGSILYIYAGIPLSEPMIDTLSLDTYNESQIENVGTIIKGKRLDKYFRVDTYTRNRSFVVMYYAVAENTLSQFEEIMNAILEARKKRTILLNQGI